MARETQKGGLRGAERDAAGPPPAEPAIRGEAEDGPSGRGRPLEPGLHFIATPIGAADDITLRALSALRQADALAAEDTRSLRKLMDLHGIALGDRPLIAYHEHNADGARPRILERLARGESVVYASEAGTPLIADPGFKLAAAARAACIAVRVAPGPSAALAALLLSGLPTDAFAFLGFPPAKTGPRRRLFAAWAAAPASLVLFEAPHRLAESLHDLAETLGSERPAALVREITKRHEETIRDTLGALRDRFAAASPPKGEIALVVGAAPARAASETAIDAALTPLLAQDTLKNAVGTVVERLGAPRKMVYARALAIKGRDHPSPGDHDGGDPDHEV